MAQVLAQEVITMRNCGFCKIPGHQIGQCRDINIEILLRLFNNIVNQTVPGSNGNTEVVFNWLSSKHAPVLKMLAYQHGLRTSLSNNVIISKIMDFYFYNHANPYWHNLLPAPELVLERNACRRMRIRISFMQRNYLRLPIPISMRQMARMGITELNQLYYVLQDEIALLPPVERHDNYYYANNPHNVERKYNITQTMVSISDKSEDKDKDEDDQYAVKECPICYENVPGHNMVELNCKHEFCGECLSETLKTTSRNKEPTCALCRADMQTFTTHSQQIYDEIAPMLLMQAL
jgi:hypothetical protein